MSCSAMDLSAYVDGELDGPRAAQVEAHLATCSACGAEVADLRDLAAALVAQAVPGPRAEAVDRAVAQARAVVLDRARRPSLWRSLARFLRARVELPAPALAFGLAAALLIGSRSTTGLEPTRLRVTVMPQQRQAARQAVYQVWQDAGELWERPATTTAGPRVIYQESVRL